jgi:hypothetical protein
MVRGEWNPGSTVWGRTESRMATVMIRQNVVDHWCWWETWRISRAGSMGRSDGSLWRLLAASAFVELMGSAVGFVLFLECTTEASGGLGEEAGGEAEAFQISRLSLK